LKNRILVLTALVLSLVSLVIFIRTLSTQDEPIVMESNPEKNTDELAELKAEVGLIKTHYHAGERIWAHLGLNNLGAKPFTLQGAGPTLTFKVYDEENRIIISQIIDLQLDEFNFRPIEVYHRERWFGHIAVVLDQPGRYKVVARADLNLDENLTEPLYTYAEPIWIEIVTGRKAEFWPIIPHAETTIPQEVENWIENSLKFDIAMFVNAKEYAGRQYLFARSSDYEPFKRLVRIEDVLIMEEEVAVKVSFTKPSLDQPTVLDDLYDVVYITATGLPVRFVPIADEDVFIRSIVGIHYLPDIVAQSRLIKVFTPAPNTVVGRKFSVSGVDFKNELHFKLLDANNYVVYSGITTGTYAPGFTRDPVIVEEHLRGASYWWYFTFEVEIPENVQDGEYLTLKFLSYLGEGDEIKEDNIVIPLKFELE